MAPSHIKGGHWDYNWPLLFFPFLYDVLQAKKLVELEGIVGTKVKAEEEPEDATIMDSGRDALRPLGMDIISFSNKFSLSFGVFGQQPPWYSFTSGALW